MRFCKFCKTSFAEDDFSHWVKNGKSGITCKIRRLEKRISKREEINFLQNKKYLSKRKTPTKENRLKNIKQFALENNGECLSSCYNGSNSPLSFWCKIHFFEWKALWSNVKNGTWCPKCGQEKRELTLLKNFGVKNPSQNVDLRLKAARKSNKSQWIKHWQTGELISCQGSYELAVCNYFNKNQISYLSQVSFNMPNGRKFFVDFYLPLIDLYIEVKGYMYPDAKVKWSWFHENYPNSELWDKMKLKELKILKDK